MRLLIRFHFIRNSVASLSRSINCLFSLFIKIIQWSQLNGDVRLHNYVCETLTLQVTQKRDSFPQDSRFRKQSLSAEPVWLNYAHSVPLLVGQESSRWWGSAVVQEHFFGQVVTNGWAGLNSTSQGEGGSTDDDGRRAFLSFLFHFLIILLSSSHMSRVACTELGTELPFSHNRSSRGSTVTVCYLCY